jgi:hypothetical protein
MPTTVTILDPKAAAFLSGERVIVETDCGGLTYTRGGTIGCIGTTWVLINGSNPEALSEKDVIV